MLPALISLKVTGRAAQKLSSGWAHLWWPELEHRHGQELLAAVTVVLHGRVVDGKELVAVAVIDPHRHGIAVKEQSERRLPLGQVGQPRPFFVSFQIPC